MTTLPQMSIVIPTRGAAGSGHWADVLDANLALIDSHDHAPGKGTRVTPAGINIDRDLTFNSSWAATALNRVTFASVAPPAVNKSCFVGDGTGGTTANELYWTNALGTNVKITAGNALNVAGFAGAIGGDYTSVSAQLNYNDSGKKYTFAQGAADSLGWARLYCGGLRLAEFGTTETLYVEQVAPAALASSYAMTWPTALPASAQAVQIDNAGLFSFSNTFTQAVTFSAAVTMTSSLAVTGAFTAGGTVTVAAGMGEAVTGTFTRGTDGFITSTASGTWYIPIQLPAGAKVTSATVAGFGDGAVDVTLQINYTSKSAVTVTKGTASITNAPASWVDTTITPGSPTAMAAGDVCHILVAPNATGFVFNNVRVTFSGS